MRILSNAQFLSLNSTAPLETALAIEHGRIIAIGDDLEMAALAHSPREVENMQGRFILPGLCDAHLHLLEFGRFLSKIDCETLTRNECLQRVKKTVEQLPAGRWVLGHGWNHNQWTEGMGNAQLLDEISNQHPIYLTAKSLHVGWVNSAALALAGIDDTTRDPHGGLIQRDSTGKPTGILLESAMRLVEDNLPIPSLDENMAALSLAQNELIKLGITSVHDFDQWDAWKSMLNLDENNQLLLRVIKGIPRDHLDEVTANKLQQLSKSEHLTIGALKLFSDGALGPQTAAMLSPYKDNLNNEGMLLMDVDEIVQVGYQAINHGIPLAVHAIGDRANQVVLRAFSILRRYELAHQIPALRHRIEHVQLIKPSDQQRMAALHIIASMQPIHATSDLDMAVRYWGSRCKYAYAWNSLSNFGVRLAFGSDAPVESPNPFLGIYAALTRRRVNDLQTESWYPQQCLSRGQAFSAYILGPFFAAGMEKSLGRIANGFYADLIVFDRDPFTISESDLPMLKPDAVMINGEWVIRNF
jgi:predicted amidohydrolase YtcJ